jgi:hypothetical protein
MLWPALPSAATLNACSVPGRQGPAAAVAAAGAAHQRHGYAAGHAGEVDVAVARLVFTEAAAFGNAAIGFGFS